MSRDYLPGITDRFEIIGSPGYTYGTVLMSFTSETGNLNLTSGYPFTKAGILTEPLTPIVWNLRPGISGQHST
ncbi:MAG: hypothetical protein Kow0098_25670 [Ignavibacteriaceae bacterium]